MVIAPSASDLESSKSCVRSISETVPRPSQRGHMPPVLVKVRFTVLPAPRSIVIAPAPRTDGTLNENAFEEPICGCPSRLNRTRSIAFASVAVPTVERALAPIRPWSTMIAVVRPSSTSTSGRASVGMKPWTNVLYVSLMSRCDSAAMVPNTSELLPEPETPVNTVSRRFGISTLTSLRLFTRAPCTRIRSWLSPACSAGGCVSVLVAMLIVSPSVGRTARRASGPGHAARPAEASDQPAAVAHQLAAGQLVRLAPSLDPERGDAEPAVRRGQRPRVKARVRGEPVTPLLRQRVDLENLDFTLDHGHVAGVAQPQPDGPGSGQVPAGRAVRRRGHQQRLTVPVEGQRHQVRRTVRRGTGHPGIGVAGEPVLGVATTLSAGAGV